MSQVTISGVPNLVYFGCAASCTTGLTTYGSPAVQMNVTYMALCSWSSCNTAIRATYTLTCGTYSGTMSGFRGQEKTLLFEIFTGIILLIIFQCNF